MPSRRRTYSAKHRLRRRTKIAVVVLLTAVFTLGTCTRCWEEKASTRGVGANLVAASGVSARGVPRVNARLRVPRRRPHLRLQYAHADTYHDSHVHINREMQWCC